MVVSMSPTTSSMRFLEVSASFVDSDMFPRSNFLVKKSTRIQRSASTIKTRPSKRWPRSQYRHFVCLSDSGQASTNAPGSGQNQGKDRVLHTKKLRRSKKNVSDSSSARFLHQPSISREVPWDDGARRAHGYTRRFERKWMFWFIVTL
jgi:hypothetical protein